MQEPVSTEFASHQWLESFSRTTVDVPNFEQTGQLGAVVVRNTRRVRFFIASAFRLQALFVLTTQGLNSA